MKIIHLFYSLLEFSKESLMIIAWINVFKTFIDSFIKNDSKINKSEALELF